MESVPFEPGMSETADRCFCTSLHVKDAYHTKGIGEWLLSLRLAEMRRRGIPHAMMSSDWNNYWAYLFYGNYGFTLLDRTFSFRKDLHDATPASRC